MFLVFKYFFHHSKPYWRYLVLLLPCYALGILLMATIKPLIYREIIDGIIAKSTFEDILYYFYLLCGVAVASTITFRLADFGTRKFKNIVLKNITDDIFLKIHKHSNRFFEDNFTGSLVTKARRLVRSYETTYDVLIWNIWFALITTTGIFIVLFSISPLLGSVFFGWTILYLVINVTLIKYKRPKDLARAMQESKVTGVLADTLTNFLNIKMFSSFALEHRRFQEETSVEFKRREDAWKFSNFQVLVQDAFLFILLELGMIYITLYLWDKGSISVGTIILIQAYITSVFLQLWQIGKGLTRLAEAFSDAQEMIDIFELDIDVDDTNSPEKCHITAGVIDFSDVAFSYNKGISVFESFNFHIRSGEKIGLVGHSGAGKTTIVKLLLRFNNVTGGVIAIDGQDISRIAQDDLRSKIAYVPQEPILFHRTLRENIMYGNPDATKEELVTAAKNAHAHDFITSLPSGYDTLVGERGIKLSGGERQRVAIARAMLKNAPILILDEATSALDSVSEKLIQEAFAKLMEGRTTIVIAHRLSTIQKMDRIIVLENGQISEEGSHAELIKNDGIYNTFWQEQAGGFIQE